MRRFLITVILLSILISMPWAVRTREHYETRRASGAPFKLIFPPHLRRMADRVSRILDQSYWEIAREVGLERIDTVTIYIAGDKETYRRFHDGLVPEWGVAYSRWHGREMGIDAGAVLNEPRPLEVVIRHELSHIVLAERIGGVPCPRWFVEGLAMLQSSEWTFEDQWGLVRSVSRKSLPSLEELKGPFPGNAGDAILAYRVSYYAVEELMGDRQGELVTLTAFIRDLGNFDEPFTLTFGETPGDYSARLHILMLNRYETAARLIRSIPYWGMLSLLCLVAYMVKRIRTLRKLRGWERAEELGEERF